MKGLNTELYVTNKEAESHELSQQLAANFIRSRITIGNVNTHKPLFYTVLVASEARDRALRVRRGIFGS